MDKKRFINFLAIACFITFPSIGNLLFAAKQERKLMIVKKFPTEEQMNSYEFVLDRGCFDCDDESIFFCAQFQHTIFQLDFEGNLIRRIGRRGQGPGEFNFPLKILVYAGNLYVTDNMNARIQVFDRDGRFKRAIKMVEVLGDLAIAKDKIFLFKPRPELQVKIGEEVPAFGIYNLSGELEKDIFASFRSKYRDIRKDLMVTLRISQGQVHCLQKYGTTYRIYNLSGQAIREFELQYDPLEDPDHKRTGYYYTFKTFCVDENNIYAPVDSKGKIIIYVFNMSGEVLGKYVALQKEKESVYDVMDMRIIKRGNAKYLYLFISSPEDVFYVAKF